jgi:hypothetical protein
MAYVLVWLPKCLHWPFCPGVFIAILAFVAAAVTFREKPGKREKAVWTFIFVGLMGAEVWMMGIDRQANEDQQRQSNTTQLKGFADIGQGIKGQILQNQQHFDATMAKSDRLIGLSKESLDNITGGDSYAWIAAGMGPQGPPFQLMVWVHGKYGVHDLAAEIQPILGGRDTETMKRQLQLKHPLPLGNGEFLPGPTPISESVGPGRYGITIISRNQWIQEQLDITQCSDGQWSEAIQMNGPGQKENNRWKGRPDCNRPF